METLCIYEEERSHSTIIRISRIMFNWSNTSQEEDRQRPAPAATADFPRLFRPTTTFDVVESSSDDSDGSSSKGRRRFRRRRKELQWLNLPRRYSQQRSRLHAVLVESMNEISLQCPSYAGSEVSDLSCLEVYGDEDWLEVYDDDDDRSSTSAEVSTKMDVRRAE